MENNDLMDPVRRQRFTETTRGLALQAGRAAEESARPGIWQRLSRRQRSLTFLACVVLPTAIVGGYEYLLASDQYISEFKFVVRQQAPQNAAPAGLLSTLGGGNPMLAVIEDSEIVVQYIGSLQILSDLRGRISLDSIYATPRADWFSRLAPGLPAERQKIYWQSMVKPYFDLSSGVITVQIHAFTPGDATRVAKAVLASSQTLVDQMSMTARQNALSYAGQTAEQAQSRLQTDETALAAYRNKYSVLFPEMSAQSSTSVAADLTRQLSEAQADLASLLSMGQTGASPQVRVLRARISAIQTQVNRMAAHLAANDGGTAISLATIVSGYDTLIETEKLDEQLYASDLLALQNARNTAAETSTYLESFVQPNLPVVSIYPERGLVTAETALAGFIAWILLTLVVNTLRDQLD